MIKFFVYLKSIFHDYQTLIVAVTTLGISLFYLLHYMSRGLLVAYGDAESHLNIAKRVTSSITPGIGQLGGVWLPLQHVLMLPFIWNDYLWRSGLAGSFVSMLAFVATTVFIFKSIQLLTRSSLASWLGTLVFLTNANILYMQATPMGELPLLAALTGSVYFFLRWADSDSVISLLLSACFAFAGSLIRYDAWFLIIFQVIMIVLVCALKRRPFVKTEGAVVLFGTLAGLGIVLWLIWNYLIFQNPVYFLVSPYSAHSQQMAWLSRGQLPSYHNAHSSLIFYALDIVMNVGVAVAALFAVSLVVSLIYSLFDSPRRPLYLAALLYLVPFPFYVLTLYLGISIILLPPLVPDTFISNLFNARYGLMMAPAAAVYAGTFAGLLKVGGKAILILVIAIQVLLFSQETVPITLADAIGGLSALKSNESNKFLARNYDHGLVMFDDYSRTANTRELGIPMQNVIYVGNHPYWEESLEHPTRHIRWFIIRQDESDSVWAKLKDNPEFLANYHIAYQHEITYVYRRN